MSAPASAAALAPPPSAAAALELAHERVGADVALRGLHRIGLLAAAAPVAAGAALLLHESAVVGLLERVRDRAEVDLVAVVGTRAVGIALALPVAHLACIAAAAVVAVALAARPELAGLGARPCAGRGEFAQLSHLVAAQVDPHPALQAPRQHHAAIADPDQPADAQPHLVEELAHLAVAPLADDDPIPVVDALAAAVDDRLERGTLAVDVDAFEQARTRLG